MDPSACAQFEDCLVPFAEGGSLPGDVDPRELEAHLAACRRCHASVSAYRRVLGEFRNDAPVSTPPPRRAAPGLRRLNPVPALRALARRWRAAASRR